MTFYGHVSRVLKRNKEVVEAQRRVSSVTLQQRVCKSGPGKVDQFGGYAPSNQELFIRTIWSIVFVFDVRALIMLCFQIGKSGQT